MNRTRLLVWTLSAASLLVAGAAQAVDLVQAYNHALQNDPTYKVAEATWLSAKEARPLAMVGTGVAGSGLFPNLEASAEYNRNKYRHINNGDQNYSYNSRELTLTLTQPIFNLETWSGIREAGYGVKAAYATYMAAGQDLINRVANNYFEVLRAQEDLQYTITEKEAVKAQLINDLQKYQVGMTAATGVYNSQASYDEQVSNEITNRNLLLNKAENLRAITGQLYQTFIGLPLSKLPVVVPKPSNMSGWVETATEQSYAVKSAKMTLLQKRQSIKTNLAAYAPTVSAVGSYDHFSTSGAGQSVATSYNRTYAGVAVDFDLFDGGHTLVMNRQKKADYLNASDNLALVYATTKNSTRQAYLAVVSGIAKIDAGYQRIIAQQKNLEATRAAYRVGTRTMVNVLEAISDLYSAKKAWAGARYDYLEALFQLKYAAGTLSPADLVVVNAWLKKGIRMQYQQPSYKKDNYYDAAMHLAKRKAHSHAHKSHHRVSHQTHRRKHAAEKKRMKVTHAEMHKTTASQAVVHVTLMSGDDFDPNTIQLPPPV